MLEEAGLLAGVIHHPRLVLERGEGSYVWDVAGRRYLDFTAGLAVAALGHGRRDLAQVLAEQFAKLGHCSNLYGNVPALDLARRLIESSFAARVWFANSGTEANEAALKFARVYARQRGGARRNQIVAFQGGFHGRTLGALSATWTPHYRRPFQPLVPGVRFAPFNDLQAARRLVSQGTFAVIVEPVQGEGGVVPADPGFLQGLRALCDEHDALLVFDEVQCGMGRLGTLYAYQGYAAVPDLMTLAKPLAGGLPLGAVLISERVAATLKPGQHGSTFSGGPAACAVGVRVFDTIAQPDFLAGVVQRASQLLEGLRDLSARSPQLLEPRGRGLMQALVVKAAWRPLVPEIVTRARARGLLVTRAGDDAVRLLPPLNCSAAEVQEALGILDAVLAEVASERAAVRAKAPRSRHAAQLALERARSRAAAGIPVDVVAAPQPSRSQGGT